MADEVMTCVERKVDKDCVCLRRRNGTILLCLWHGLQEQRVRESARRKYAIKVRRHEA
jgi:hypothetical protein